MSSRMQIEPDTTLYPVPVVLVTCGTPQEPNVFTINRIASCNAEPPMLCLSIRPSRASHDLIAQWGEFVVNLPWPDMEVITDFVGTTTMEKTDKWHETGLQTIPATKVRAPLLAQCPVNIECQVVAKKRLPSHTLFIAEVVAMHAHAEVLNERHEVDFSEAGGGLAYRSGPVRERPVDKFKPESLWRSVHHWRDENS